MDFDSIALALVVDAIGLCVALPIFARVFRHTKKFGGYVSSHTTMKLNIGKARKTVTLDGH
jgi:hypothetical protein